MSHPAKFRFVMQTKLPSNRTSELVLAETDNFHRASQIKTRILSEAGTFSNLRPLKKLKVYAVDEKRFRAFNPAGKLPIVGTIFKSVEHLAGVIGGNPLTLRTRMSQMRKASKGTDDTKVRATLRGVTYGYV